MQAGRLRWYRGAPGDHSLFLWLVQWMGGGQSFPSSPSVTLVPLGPERPRGPRDWVGHTGRWVTWQLRSESPGGKPRGDSHAAPSTSAPGHRLGSVPAAPQPQDIDMMPLKECSQTQHMPGHGPPRTILNDGATPGIVKLLHQSGCCHCFIPRPKYPDAQPCVLSLPQPVSGPPATPILHPDP